MKNIPEKNAPRFSSGSGRIEIQINTEDARQGSHQGQCNSDIEDLLTVPYISEQIDAIDKDTLKEELKEYGAWDEPELSDHEQNKRRILWIACGNIVEEENSND